MTTETPSRPAPSNPAASKRLSGERLTELLEAQRRATSELHSELRKCLAAEGNISFSPSPQAHIRRTQQLEKAHELFRQAEAKTELLVSHFGVSL
jgi:hypothetical protein